MNINIACTTSWLCDAGKDDRGRRVERGFRTRTRLTKSPQNLLWDTIEPRSTRPMAPGRLAASLGRYLGARPVKPKHVFFGGLSSETVWASIGGNTRVPCTKRQEQGRGYHPLRHAPPYLPLTGLPGLNEIAKKNVPIYPPGSP